MPDEANPTNPASSPDPGDQWDRNFASQSGDRYGGSLVTELWRLSQKDKAAVLEDLFVGARRSVAGDGVSGVVGRAVGRARPLAMPPLPR